MKSEPGRGTIFNISVPRLPENINQRYNNAETEKLLVKRNNFKKGKMKIVTFEDDIASIEYLKGVALIMGCELVNFDYAPDGISYLRENHADLVFMDIRLPEMSGLEATRIIKSEFPELPVIIQTAYAMKGDKEKAVHSGCDDYLTKPVPLNVLKEKISYYIERKNKKPDM